MNKEIPGAINKRGGVMKKSVLVLFVLFSFTTLASADSKGILIAAHGMPGTWNQKLNEWAKPFKAEAKMPLEVGFLEYTPSQALDVAVKKLEAKGVDEIFVIQVMVSSNSSHTPEIYEALESATDKTPIFCIAEGFANSAEMVESLMRRAKAACFADDNIKGDAKDIKFSEASIIIGFHGEPWGDVSNWHNLGKELAYELDKQRVFKSVDYSLNLIDRTKLIKRLEGFPVFIPQFVVSGSYVDALHPDLLLKREKGDLKYDGRCILDDKMGDEWLMRHIKSVESGTYTSYWDNGIE